MAWQKPMSTVMSPMLPAARGSVKCTLFGHRVHHSRIAEGVRTPCACCGAAILDQCNSLSRLAHTLSCFFGMHNYTPLATRAAHNEYVCDKCGHTLLFQSARDPYASQGKFKKRVNYACGLLGHRVHAVATGSKTTEYACLCGHPFIKASATLRMIRHPPGCVLLGHFVTLNQIRGDWAEYVCRRCGHPFCFKFAAVDPIDSDTAVGTL